MFGLIIGIFIGIAIAYILQEQLNVLVENLRKLIHEATKAKKEEKSEKTTEKKPRKSKTKKDDVVDVEATIVEEE